MTPQQHEHYLICLEQGCSPLLAEMLASGQPPGAMTDREFLHGHANGNQFESQPLVGDFYKAEANRHGVNTTGKVYLSGLADYPGDPQAWVSGRGDAQRLCEERGWGCEGAVKVKATNFAETGGKYKVAEDIIEDRVEEMAALAPDPHDVNREDLREKAVQALSPNWK